MTPILAFDIETVPDIAGVRAVRELPATLTDDDVHALITHERRMKSGSDFMPLHLQRVVAISVALREGEQFRVWSIGSEKDAEDKLIARFFDGIDKYTPQLVSWNGGGFDLPVLHYRALKHGITASRYWEWGDEDRDFKYNNYVNRYHTRHIDLMDVLAMFQPRAFVPLDEMARLCGLPGKLGMDGSKVWDAVKAVKVGEVRDYCETDVVNTYLLFLRFQRLRGVFSDKQFDAEIALVRDTLAQSKAKHWKEYLGAWG